MTLIDILMVYLAFRAKQVICDFFLQTSWMATHKGLKFLGDGGKALITHAAIHAFGTLLIMLYFAPLFWWLALVDFVIHGLIDKTKATLTLKRNWQPKDSAYWWAIGVDQELHNLTHLAFIIILVLYYPL